MRCYQMLLNKEKNFISAVVYVYNREKEIYKFLSSLNKKLCENFEKYEIICVNDASTDKSVEEIKKVASKIKGSVVSVLNMSFFQGMESAMYAGVDLAIGDFVYEFDEMDFSYSMELIMDVYYRSLQGYDIVSAAPPRKVQKITSKFFYRVFNKASHTQYLLQTESFRLLSRRGINRIRSISNTIPYRKAIYANCGLKVDTLLYESKELLQKNTDKNSFRKQKETATDAIVLYTDIAYHMSIGFSMIMMFLTVLIGLYTVGVYVIGRPVAGWTTTMLFLSFAFCGLFVILTIIIKYMSIILKLNFNKQKYILESIEKINN